MKNIEQCASHVFLVDDLLEQSYFEEVAQFAGQLEFDLPEGAASNKLWNLEKKATYPICSESIVWTKYEEAKQALQGLKKLTVYPTNTIFDKMLEKIHQVVLETGVMGDFETDWSGSISRVYKYGPGKSIKWHRDSFNYSGAYIFYLNEPWNHDWGGHLMLKEEGATDGKFFSPEPNRLVLIRSPYLHSVTPVTCPADKNRLTLTGFFVKPDRVSEIVSNFEDYHKSNS